jgi:putative peptidoglycan lipid II flippase
MGLNLLFIGVLYATHQVQGRGMHILLAIATAAGALLNSWLLYRGLRKQGVYQPAPGWSAFWLRLILANLAMAIFLYYCAGATARWLQVGTATRALWMTGLVAGGASLYFASLWLLGMRPAHLKH